MPAPRQTDRQTAGRCNIASVGWACLPHITYLPHSLLFNAHWLWLLCCCRCYRCCCLVICRFAFNILTFIERANIAHSLWQFCAMQRATLCTSFFLLYILFLWRLVCCCCCQIFSSSFAIYCALIFLLLLLLCVLLWFATMCGTFARCHCCCCCCCCILFWH